MTKNWKAYYEAWLTKPKNIRSKGVVLPDVEFNKEAEHIVALLDLNKSDTVLDVGGDSGLITNKIRPYVKRIVGIDFIKGLLKEASKGEKQASYPTYLAAEAEHLPFKKESFEKVYSYNVIHGSDTPQKAISIIHECLRVCKRGGVVLIGDIPDPAKRIEYRLGIIWLEKNWAQKLALIAGLCLPGRVKRLFRQYILGQNLKVARMLWLDIPAIQRDLDQKGYQCEQIDQPWALYCGFYRSNLKIKKKDTGRYRGCLKSP